MSQTETAGLPPPEPIEPDGALLAWVEKQSGVAAGACYGCLRCSNGCPLAFAMDYHPYQVVRLLQLGQVDELKGSRTIWLCASCHTCVTRCPNQVDLPRLMDFLKREVAASGTAAEERSLLFHRLFLNEIKARGRVHEGSLMTRYLFATDGPFSAEARSQAALGWKMLRKGRIKLLPSGIKDRRFLRAVFARQEERT